MPRKLIIATTLGSLLLAACEEAPKPVAEEKPACGEIELALKIAAYGQQTARLAEIATASSDPKARARYEEYAVRIAEKYKAIEKVSAADVKSEAKSAAVTERLCKDYDELQALADEAVSQLGTGIADRPRS